MIDIKDKKDCCGCSACVQICPRQCISMKVDEEGFEYPCIDYGSCINCSLCSKVCPIRNPTSQRVPIKVGASKNLDEDIRYDSSSGGVFTPLAESVIDDDGIVFGVSFDQNWNPVHSYTDEKDGLAAFRGAKYVQSKIGTSYLDAQAFLRKGRKVLFSGTPCQILGLRKFLGKEYANLFTVEVLCHGVPSPKVWQRYLDNRRNVFNYYEISSINFRDKENGWFGYDMTIGFKDGRSYTMPHKKDPYFKGFLKNVYLRPSCYACRCKNGRSGCDIAIGDYWSINKVLPTYNDNKGISLILIHTDKGLSLFNSISAQIDYVETGYGKSVMGRNSGFAEKQKKYRGRKSFFKKLINDSPEDIFQYRGKIYEIIKSFIYKP